MVDAILGYLFKMGDLKVIARTSSMRYKNTKLSLMEIAHELGVSALLEGSVQKIGNKVRITAQLIDPKTGFHLWSETFDRDLSDIFLIQSEVAQNVARELKAKLTSKETQLIQNAPITTNQLAYDFYLKGNDYWSKYETSLAIDMYSKAIQEDSLFTAAYAQRAKLHLYFYWDKLEGWEGHDLKAKEDIKKGNLLNPELPELKLAMAIAYYFLDRDYDNALKTIKELKAEEPNMADLYAFTSYILRRQGKWEESISEAKQSIQMDPFNANYIDNLSSTYGLLHQYDNQIECCRQGLALIPDHINFNHIIFYAYLDMTADLKVSLKESGLKEENVQYQIYYYTKQYSKLIELIKINDLKLNIEYNTQFANLINELTYHPKIFNLSLIYYLNGQKSLCNVYTDSTVAFLTEKLKEMPNDDRIYSTLGKCYAFSGNINKAIASGKKAVNMMPIKLDAVRGIVEEQDLMGIYVLTDNYDQALDKIEYLLSVPSWMSAGKLIIDPIFDNLRGLPRFQKIIDSPGKQHAVK
jgi:tetratricopeptide (TPR) repeat protein